MVFHVIVLMDLFSKEDKKRKTVLPGWSLNVIMHSISNQGKCSVFEQRKKADNSRKSRIYTCGGTRMLKELKKQLEEARVGRIDKGSRKRINSREEHEELRNNYQRVLDTYWSNVDMANNVDSDYE
ncbi:24408_t:CDS:2 [Gigaspora margarita]|uniref:24408_t:CDS:1 n=1 Tax=Gigaspora margarita TaxID=4874 RepID=A0ABN7UFY5_GIGMA|nr:24408_t:CDS:2 [Gigaspora margarita]